jgi:hypothetical protein
MTRPDHVTPQRAIIAADIAKIAPDLSPEKVKELALYMLRREHDEYFHGVHIGIRMGQKDMKLKSGDTPM